MPSWMIGAQGCKAAMSHGHQCTGGGRFKLNFDLRMLMRGKVGIAPREGELVGRFPDAHTADLDDVLGSLGLE